MNRISALSGLAVLCVASVTFGQCGSEFSLTETRHSRSPVNHIRNKDFRSPVQALLLKRVEQVHWDEVPFHDVVGWISAQRVREGRVNVIPKWAALALEGVD